MTMRQAIIVILLGLSGMSCTYLTEAGAPPNDVVVESYVRGLIGGPLYSSGGRLYAHEDSVEFIARCRSLSSIHGVVSSILGAEGFGEDNHGLRAPDSMRKFSRSLADGEVKLMVNFHVRKHGFQCKYDFFAIAVSTAPAHIDDVKLTVVLARFRDRL